MLDLTLTLQMVIEVVIKDARSITVIPAKKPMTTLNGQQLYDILDDLLEILENYEMTLL